ncbi:MAG TPA: hypothetical protein VLT90_00745 [Terriglobales bacterium]|nr:hypothetical protein [Terriglobales bacterium]
MWPEDTEQAVHLNWTPILSLTGSIACSLAIWLGLYRAIVYFVK